MVKSFWEKSWVFFFLIQGENTCCWEKFRAAVGDEAEWKERISIESAGGRRQPQMPPRGGWARWRKRGGQPRLSDGREVKHSFFPEFGRVGNWRGPWSLQSKQRQTEAVGWTWGYYDSGDAVSSRRPGVAVGEMEPVRPRLGLQSHLYVCDFGQIMSPSLRSPTPHRVVMGSKSDNGVKSFCKV